MPLLLRLDDRGNGPILHLSQIEMNNPGLGPDNGSFRRNREGINRRSGEREHQEAGEHCTREREVP